MPSEVLKNSLFAVCAMTRGTDKMHSRITTNLVFMYTPRHLWCSLASLRGCAGFRHCALLYNQLVAQQDSTQKAPLPSLVKPDGWTRSAKRGSPRRGSKK